jgi:hypothetical protein
VVIEELELLKDLSDLRKSGFWRKLKDSNYKVPIIIVVLLLFGTSAFFTWTVLTEIDVDETTEIDVGYHVYYILPVLYQGDEVEVYYNVEGKDNNLDVYIVEKSYYDLWFEEDKIHGKEFHGDATYKFSYTIPQDGAYYFIFENPNEQSITVDVRIEDQDLTLAGYICYLPVTLLLLILLVFLLIPQELMPDPESETSSFDYYNIDNTNGYILFGLGWFFAIFSVINLFSFLGSTLLSVSPYAMSSFYILIMLALSLPISFVCFEYSEAYGFRNPWKLVGK